LNDKPVKISPRFVKPQGHLSFGAVNNAEINYTLPVSGNVKLQLLNLQGKKISTLLDGFRKSGSHSLKWDGNKSGSNMYILRLESEKCFIVKKIAVFR
jgi:flagellar hook assembly protein FlgD